MPCLLGILAFFLPRVAIILLALFSSYIGSAFAKFSPPFNGLLLPILGFIFMPYTLLAVAFSMNANNAVNGWYLVLVIVAVLMDLGVIGGGAKTRTRTVVVKKD